MRATTAARRRKWSALCAAMLPVVALVAAHGARRPVAAHAAVTPRAAVDADTGQHLPDAAAAAPIDLARASASDRARALQCLTDAIYYEAGNEPDRGQRAIAQVVLNRVRHPAFPATVCGVVYQGAQAPGCQFSFACDGALARRPSRARLAQAGRVAAAALAGYVFAPVGLATHYHTFAVTPAWNRTLVMTDVEGAHFFHRWKGHWGTAAAFRQVYAGGEPPLGPPAATAPPPVAPPPLPTGTPVAVGLPVTPPSTDDCLPPASAILPKWQDAGTPR